MLLRAIVLCALFLAAPPSVKAAGQQQTLPSASLFALVEEFIGSRLDRSDGSEYKIERLTRLPESIFLPEGTLAVAPELVGAIRYNTPVQVKIAIAVNGAPQMNLLTAWRVRKFSYVLVTVRDIPARTVLSEADVLLERREVARFDDVISDVGYIAGLETKRPLTAGSVVTKSALGRPQAIRAGDNITIVSRAGAVTVQVAGQALQGGAVGDVIRVRNLNSGKSLLARVESATTVVVSSFV
ncbi:MAG: flagellar basal body P-ring formation chaperone FlgA [Acidaminococcales bacterium]|jgi:flagella basal body P-ring formation protein FlgA|nr:flagellar basal body P-ring formation chaperone FlgA [Acidaminococcales bacterium]